MSERELFQRIALHFAMGAALGALFIASLLVLNVQNIMDVVWSSPSPAVATAILVTGASVYFAFGAAITGFHFMIMGEHSARSIR